MKNYVPKFKKQVIDHASLLQKNMESYLSCYSLAYNIFNIEDSVCGAGL